MPKARRLDACHCRKAPCLCRPWESALRAEGLGHLDTVSGPDRDSFMPSRRGAGVEHPRPNTRAGLNYTRDIGLARQESIEEREHRLAILANHRFRTAIQRRIWEVYAAGLSMHEVAREVGRNYRTVYDSIRAVRLQYAESLPTTEEQLGELLRECDRPLLAWVFELLQRAIEAPEEMERALERLRASAQVRAIMETR